MSQRQGEGQNGWLEGSVGLRHAGAPLAGTKPPETVELCDIVLFPYWWSCVVRARIGIQCFLGLVGWCRPNGELGVCTLTMVGLGFSRRFRLDKRTLRERWACTLFYGGESGGVPALVKVGGHDWLFPRQAI